MSRYINAVECAEIISEKFNIPLYDLVDVFAEIPTADVVPKSEVAEIIEEAFKMMQDNFVNTPIYKVFPSDLKAELKKKYTETYTPECKTYTLDVKNTEEKYFTPQDVRNMTPKEIHDNFSAIRRSMETWN